jgi:hypothetical protein
MEMIPLLVTLLLVIGATILWRRTGRASALVQLIAVSVLFLLACVDDLGRFLLITGGHDALIEALHTRQAESFASLASYLSSLAFLIGYIWHAISCRRI